MAQDAQRRAGPKPALNRVPSKGPVSLRAADGRWGTRLGRWLADYGVPNVRLALRRQGLRTGVHTVYAWIAGQNVPRADAAYALVKLSRGKLTMDDVYEHSREVRRDGPAGSGTPAVAEGTQERHRR